RPNASNGAVLVEGSSPAAPVAKLSNLYVSSHRSKQMKDFAKRIAELSPEKRELPMRRLDAQDLRSEKRQTIPRRSQPGHYPLSYSQQRLWFLDQIEPGSPFYNVPVAAYLGGPLNLAALEWSLNEIV